MLLSWFGVGVFYIHILRSTTCPFRSSDHASMLWCLIKTASNHFPALFDFDWLHAILLVASALR